MAERATFTGQSETLERLLARLPLVLSGRAADVQGVRRGMMLRLGVGLLSKVQQDFIRKSRGETGEDGIKWLPLKPETVAQRRITAGERKAAGVGRKTTRGLLNAAQDRRWRSVFASCKARMMAQGMSADAAASSAAKTAWGVVKAAGAKTKIGLFGNRKVDSLRDTGELLRSLSPGVADRPSRAPGQVFVVDQGSVTVGTNKKTWHHRGVPGKLPARPFWPLDGSIPEAWWRYLLEAYSRGLSQVLAKLMAGGSVK